MHVANPFRVFLETDEIEAGRTALAAIAESVKPAVHRVTMNPGFARIAARAVAFVERDRQERGNAELIIKPTWPPPRN